MSVPDAGVSSVLKMSGALFFILGMLLLVFYFMRRLNLGVSFSGVRNKELQIVERLPLGPRQNITVIKYRGQDLVLGVTQDKITLLQAREEVHGKDEKDFAGFLKKENTGSSDS
ncbi:MAG: flagellar biosynthetic protein FliO [Maridesulfovibrio ferrireducens]|nr:flagellar biosynthetic protein FliO [Maridesulfovibrio ferrireducens]